jgi:peptidoglycan/LPS O-acetylase OafA/YrhL
LDTVTTSTLNARAIQATGTAAPARHPPAEAFQIPSLDGIRAASFFVVFVAHAGLDRIVPSHFGLTLFFFLSGYLITTLLRMEYEKTGTVSIRQFYLRRVLRIFPPFYLVLSLSALLTWAGFLIVSLDPKALLAQCLHLTNYFIISHGWWGRIPPGTAVYWSLAVEEHFYLAFPLLFLFLRRRMTPRKIAAVLLGLCAAFLAWRFVLVFALDASKERTYVASDTRMDAILFGCILAVWQNPVLDREGSVSDRMLGLVWLPLGVAMVIFSVVVRVHEFDQTLRYTLQSAGVGPFFVAAIRWHDRWPFRVFSLRPMKYVGLVSYSLYLLHEVALRFMHYNTSLPPIMSAAVAFVAIMLGASGIYRYVEKPCGALRRKLSRYLEGAAAMRTAS